MTSLAPTGHDFSLDLPVGDVTWINPPDDERGDQPRQPLGRVVGLTMRAIQIEIDGHCPLDLGGHPALCLDDGHTRLELAATVTYRDTTGFRHWTCTLRFDELSDPQRDPLRRLMGSDPAQLQVAWQTAG